MCGGLTLESWGLHINFIAHYHYYPSSLYRLTPLLLTRPRGIHTAVSLGDVFRVEYEASWVIRAMTGTDYALVNAHHSLDFS